MFGLTLSLVYGLIAVGFALIFGCSRIFDLSFGAYYLVGGYTYFGLTHIVGVGRPAAVILALVCSTFLAWLIHRFVLYPLRKNPIAVLISSVAIALVIQQIIIILFETEFRAPSALIGGTTTLFGATLANQRYLAGGVALVCMALLWLFLNKTKQGQGIGALVTQPEAAQLMGVDPKAAQLTVACIGGLFAGLAGLLTTPVFSLHPWVWLDALLLAFAGVVIGGLGSIPGCLLAMFIVGFSETLVSFLIYGGAFFKEAVYLVIMVIVLLVRPWGLFGKSEEL